MTVTKVTPRLARWPYKPHRLYLFLLQGLVVCSLLSFTSPAQAMDDACRSLYKQKKFIKAAACFKGLLKTIDANKALKSFAPTLKNKALGDAAVCYSSAAAKASTPQDKAHRKEQAVMALDDALGRPFCAKAGNCANQRKMHKRFTAEVQYSRLAIHTKAPNPVFVVKGFQYTKEVKGSFNQKIRPGTYEITMKAKGQPEKKRSIVIKPLTSATITMESPTIKIKQIIVAKKIPPLVLVGYIGGGVLLLGGVALAVVGYVTQSSLNTCRSNPDCAQDATAYDREFDQGGAFIAIGYATAAAGIVFVGSTAVAQVFANRNPANQPPPKLSSSTSLGSFGWTH